MSNPKRANFARNPFLICGVAFALAITVLGVFSPFIGPYNHLDQQLRLRHLPPLSSGVAVDRAADPPREEQRFFLLGTDHLGRDYLSRLIASFRISAYTGLLAWVIGTGSAWLLIALFGGPTSVARQSRTFPWVILNTSPLMLTALMLGINSLLFWITLRLFRVASLDLVTFFPIFALWVVLAALIPASILYQSVQQKESAPDNNLTQGNSSGWPVLRQAIIIAPVSISLAVLASLLFEIIVPWSFLGFGIQPPNSSLGLMLAQGRQYIGTAPWVVQIPIATSVVAVGAFLAIALPIRASRLRAASTVVSSRGALEMAPIRQRIGAFVLDIILLWTLQTFWSSTPLWLIAFVFPYYANLDIVWVFRVSPILLYVLWAVYFPLFWAISGQTPGMKIFNIKVVRMNGTRLSMPRAVLRLIGFTVSGAALFIGFIWALFDSQRQGWHDKIAGTLVVRVEAQKEALD